MGLFEGHFPYSNFHQANFDWILWRLRQKELHSEIFNASMLESVDSVTPTASKLTITYNRADYSDGARTGDTEAVDLPAATPSAAGVMTAAQAAALSKAASDISALEGSDIMDATTMENVKAVTPSASNVAVTFNRATYTDGSRSATTDGSATIPAATTSAAGVMTAAQVTELTQDTAKIALIGDAYAEALSAAVTLNGNTNTRIMQHDFVNGYWILAGGVAFEVTVPNTVSGTTQVDLAASISSDPAGPGWVGMRNTYLLPAGTYHIALPCSARAYNFNTGGTSVTTNGCVWAYFKDVNSAGVTVRVLTNFTSETGNKTELEAVRII